MAIGVNYIDRATVAVANLDIRHEFGLNATEIGALVSVWSLCFAFSQLPMGWLVDRVGPRPLLGFSLLIWSVAQAAGGFVGGFGQLLWARGVLHPNPTDPADQACFNAMPALKNLNDRLIGSEAQAVVDALKRPGRFVAVFDLGATVMPGGILDRLRAHGVAVSAPVP